MKLLAFRIDHRAIIDHVVVERYFVRAQRSTDYNWPTLKDFNSMEAAKRYIRSICDYPIRQPVYGPDGYEINI